MLKTLTELVALAAVVAMVGVDRLPSRSLRHRYDNHRGIIEHNLGDHDADNNGGPSDGDGRI